MKMPSAETDLTKELSFLIKDCPLRLAARVSLRQTRDVTLNYCFLKTRCTGDWVSLASRLTWLLPPPCNPPPHPPPPTPSPSPSPHPTPLPQPHPCFFSTNGNQNEFVLCVFVLDVVVFSLTAEQKRLPRVLWDFFSFFLSSSASFDGATHTQRNDCQMLFLFMKKHGQNQYLHKMMQLVLLNLSPLLFLAPSNQVPISFLSK